MCNTRTIDPAVSEKKIFEIVDDGRLTDGRRTDTGAWVYNKSNQWVNQQYPKHIGGADGANKEPGSTGAFGESA